MKPSLKIKEIYIDLQEANSDSLTHVYCQMEAIVLYLDEEYEKSQFKPKHMLEELNKK